MVVVLEWHFTVIAGYGPYETREQAVAVIDEFEEARPDLGPGRFSILELMPPVHLRKYPTDTFALCGSNYHRSNTISFAKEGEKATCWRCLEAVKSMDFEATDG